MASTSPMHPLALETETDDGDKPTNTWWHYTVLALICIGVGVGIGYGAFGSKKSDACPAVAASPVTPVFTSDPLTTFTKAGLTTAAWDALNNKCPIPNQPPGLSSGWVAPSYADQSLFTEKCVTVVNNRASGVNYPSVTLYGSLTVPTGAGPFPVVVLIGGSGPTNMDGSDHGSASAYNKPYKDIAYGLSTQGVAVLRLNKRSAEIAYYINPQGHFDQNENNAQVISQEYIYDTLAALAQVASMSTKIDSNKIILAGHSLGAEIAPTICKMAAPTVKGCILLASVVKGFTSVIPWQSFYLESLVTYPTLNVAALNASAACYYDLNAHVDPGYIRPSSCNPFYPMAQKFYQSAIIFEPPPKVVDQLTMPVLVAQGKADYNVPYNLPFGPGGFSTYGHEFLKEISFMSTPGGWNAMFASSSRVTLKVYQDLCHLFYKITPNPLGLSDPGLQAAPNLHVEKAVIDDLATWVKTKV